MADKITPGQMLDQLIENGGLLATINAREVFVLRTIGLRWQDLVRGVVGAHKEVMAHPTGFGQVHFAMTVTRKYTENNVIGTQVIEIDLPEDMFVWPKLR